MTDELPDIIARHLDVLFCGINPGMTAAMAGHHFVQRSNRFWRVIHLAGFTPEEIRPQNDHAILGYGCGLTTVVRRPTASADQLSPDEFVSAASAFEQKIERYAPRFVAFLGKVAYAALSGQKDLDKLARWWGRADWQKLSDMPREKRKDGLVLRMKRDLGYKSAKAWPIYERQDGGLVMYYMIHASDHPEGPTLMSRETLDPQPWISSSITVTDGDERDERVLVVK